jgi:hypothetical protein
MRNKSQKANKEIILRKHKILSDLEAKIVESDPVTKQMIQSIHSVKHYEVVFLLENAMFLFYWFIEIMTFRTVFVWSHNIKDEQVLSSIYSIIFRTIYRIQTHLSEFLKTSKIGYSDPTPLDNVAFYFNHTPDLRLRPYYLTQYQVLGRSNL